MFNSPAQQFAADPLMLTDAFLQLLAAPAADTVMRLGPSSLACGRLRFTARELTLILLLFFWETLEPAALSKYCVCSS